MVINWTHDRVHLRDLRTWERNPRHITKRQAERLLASWDEFGQVETIAIDASDVVVNGHQRLSVLLAAYGPDYVVDVRRADRALTDAERERLTLLLHAGATGGWDWDALANWDADMLLAGGMDDALRAVLKQDIKALDNLLDSIALEEPPEDPGAQVSIADELRERWGVESGQLWRIPSHTADGEHRIVCGDCTDAQVVERVLGGSVISLVVADPPYGIWLDTDYSSFTSARSFGRGRKHDRIIGDDAAFDFARVVGIDNVKEQFWFGADYYIDTIPAKWRGSWLVWDKRVTESADRMYGSAFELILSRSKHKRTILRHKWAGLFTAGEARLFAHPTEKPVSLIEALIEMPRASNVVYDPFLGSGTTLVACERTGRLGRGVEIAPKYVAVALQRLADMGLEPELVDETRENRG